MGLNNFEEDKIWRANEEIRRRESVAGSITYNSRRGSKMIPGRRFRDILEMMRAGSHFQKNRRPTLMKRCWGMLRWGGRIDHH